MERTKRDREILVIARKAKTNRPRKNWTESEKESERERDKGE